MDVNLHEVLVPSAPRLSERTVRQRATLPFVAGSPRMCMQGRLHELVLRQCECQLNVCPPPGLAEHGIWPFLPNALDRRLRRRGQNLFSDVGAWRIQKSVGNLHLTFNTLRYLHSV